MSKIISFASQKGGVGKTTLLMLTASALHSRMNKRMVVIDCDQQASIKHIYEKENNDMSYPVINFDWAQKNSQINFTKIIALCQLKYDFIFLDLPSKSEKNDEIYNSLVISDIIIIPVIASRLDIISTIKFLNTLPKITKIRKDKKMSIEIYGIINKKDSTREYRELDFLKQLSGIGNIKLFYTPISMSVDYKRKISTVHDPVDPQAKHEFNTYFEEFITKCVF